VVSERWGEECWIVGNLLWVVYGLVPVGWEIVRLKLLEGNNNSVIQTGPFGAQLHASDYLDEGVPLILIRNVHDLKIDETNMPGISKEDAERLFIYRLDGFFQVLSPMHFQNSAGQRN